MNTVPFAKNRFLLAELDLKHSLDDVEKLVPG